MSKIIGTTNYPTHAKLHLQESGISIAAAKRAGVRYLNEAQTVDLFGPANAIALAPNQAVLVPRPKFILVRLREI